MLKQWRKKRTLKRFLVQLPADLMKRYGGQDYYTPGQLRRTLDEGDYPGGYIGYAQVLFLSRNDALNEIGVESVYDAIRQELADAYFDGDKDFVVTPVRKRQVGNIPHSSFGEGYSTTGSQD